MTIRHTRLAVLLLAAASLATMLVAAGKLSVAVVLFALWVAAPFAVTFQTLADSDSIVHRVGALLISTLATLGYVAVVLPAGRASSTSGLAFVFHPIWQFLLIAAVLAIAAIQERLASRVRGR